MIKVYLLSRYVYYEDGRWGGYGNRSLCDHLSVHRTKDEAKAEAERIAKASAAYEERGLEENAEFEWDETGEEYHTIVYEKGTDVCGNKYSDWAETVYNIEEFYVKD